MARHVWRAALAMIFIVAMATTALGCGVKSNCEIGDRNYLVYLPESFGEDGPGGAIVFAHGYRGSAANVMGDHALRRVADELGVALIAANDAGADWSIPGAQVKIFDPTSTRSPISARWRPMRPSVFRLILNACSHQVFRRAA